jgi:pilus assembly protein CpaE
MKIVLISPNPVHLEEMGNHLDKGSHQARRVLGGKSRMREIAEQDAPDLMLVDGMCCDPTELSLVEHITTNHPGTAVVLLCASQTPEFLINSMRVGVREVLPSPASPEALDGALARVATKLKPASRRQPGKVLAFMPCKGGSGATFLAANLGFQLAETKSVLLVDLNLQFGDALSFVHDGAPHATLADLSRDISRLDASFLAACTVKVAPNFQVLAAPEDMAQAMDIKPEHIDAILALALTQYDFVLLDMSRTLDTLAIKALDRASQIFPVLQATLPGVRNASKLLAVFRSLGYAPSKMEVIVNRYEKTSPVSLDGIQRSLGVTSLRTVPNSYKEVNDAINHGTALAREARSSAVTRNLADFALALSPRVEESRSLLGRLFKRA